MSEPAAPPPPAAAILPAHLRRLHAVAAPDPQPTPPAAQPAGDLLTPAEQAEFDTANALAYHLAHTHRLFQHARTDHRDVLAWVHRYLTDPEAAGNLLLSGPTGTGKTHAVYGALRALAESGRPPVGWLAVTETDLFSELHPRGPGDDPENRFARYATAPLLFLDDLGSAKRSAWNSSEVLFRLVEHRYRACLPLLATTNLLIPELAEAIGARTASRLGGTCQIVTLTGADRRLAR